MKRMDTWKIMKYVAWTIVIVLVIIAVGWFVWFISSLFDTMNSMIENFMVF